MEIDEFSKIECKIKALISHIKKEFNLVLPYNSIILCSTKSTLAEYDEILSYKIYVVGIDIDEFEISFPSYCVGWYKIQTIIKEFLELNP